MGIFAKLFGKKEKSNTPNEYKEALACNNEYESLLSTDKYIARSDYAPILDKYKDIYRFFQNAQQARTLTYYCKRNHLQVQDIEKFLRFYSDSMDLQKGSTIINEHNNKYVREHLVSEKSYLDNILHEVDPKILLDDEQRQVILSDEDYTLIIAGAGAGKTTTVAAKVRYLVERQHIDPKQILVISFTNKAVGELKERINEGLLLPCPITTFHSAGYSILRKQDDIKKKIVGDGFLYNAVNNYLKGNILAQPELVEKLVMFFGSYFDAPYEGDDINLFFNYIAKADFSTLKSNLNEYNEQIIDRRTSKVTTITNEIMRSMQEVRIANFLYLNQIDYVYEDIYPYHILKAKKPYTPDFCIRQGNRVAYIEHFGITENGNHNFYSTEELNRYKQEIQDKIALHKKHGTTLIYTYSKYNDNRDLLVHLQEQLEKNGFVLNERSSEEVFTKLVNTEENKYIIKLVKLICTFINNFKTNGYTLDDFYRLERTNANVRTKLFLDVCKACYLEYQKKLSEENAIDFQDMINDSARFLREKQIANEQLDFKYIIVDEYQDISRQRFDLTKELSKMCKAKIIAVGDDWQSIYAFSGSDISLFTHFCSIMGYGQELKITRTYRNAQEVIDIAGNFIQRNDTQIKKSLISPKHIRKPVVIQTYSEDYDRKQVQGKGGKYYYLGKQVEDLIGKILELNAREGKGNNSSILLIGRFNFDARNLCFSKDFVYDEYNGKIFSKKFPQAKLEFLTAHSSKGLGYDNVIIVNARNEIYGFPSKIDDDPVMKHVVKDDTSIEYAEERRLFYVAMTRTKNRVFIVTPEKRPSEFILELKRDYPNITIHGDLNEDESSNIGMMKKCPICGYPLQLRYKKNYGFRLWMCTNEPEICNFISNELIGGDMQIQKCDWCQDGYLVVKKTSNGAILGCTNYKSDDTGCNRRMAPEYYHRWITSGFEDDESVDKPSYQKEVKQEMPKIKPIKEKPVQTERRVAQVHTTKYSEKFIEKDGFQVVTDDDGNILTNMDLLYRLRSLRSRIMKEENRPAYTIISNKGLVSLATYRPTTREEFISLYGLGEMTYNAYGMRFIQEIKKFFS
ncbi:MAG: UvrD-helicase domain-containing protein [Clostridiales bacterium]|nr:UvrD-helicase domain-containing protein [Clostridiales bacterium]